MVEKKIGQDSVSECKIPYKETQLRWNEKRKRLQIGVGHGVLDPDNIPTPATKLDVDGITSISNENGIIGYQPVPDSTIYSGEIGNPGIILNGRNANSIWAEIGTHGKSPLSRILYANVGKNELILGRKTDPYIQRIKIESGVGGGHIILSAEPLADDPNYTLLVHQKGYVNVKNAISIGSPVTDANPSRTVEILSTNPDEATADGPARITLNSNAKSRYFSRFEQKDDGFSF